MLTRASPRTGFRSGGGGGRRTRSSSVTRSGSLVAAPPDRAPHYDVLGILFTNTCNFRCRHCCTESHPLARVNIDLDLARACVDEAATVEGIREIGISGGEPFLFRADLATLVRYAADRGFSVSVTSNGFWATSPTRASEILEELHDDGLRSLNLSISPFHLEFGLPERICFAATAAVELGLTTRVNCVETPSFTVTDAKELLVDLPSTVEFVPMPCIPAGRAKEEASGPADLSLQPGIPRGGCSTFFTKLAVTTSGDVFPCCSPGGFTPALKLGNVSTKSIKSILDELEDNALVQVLSAVGPAFFVPFVRERVGSALFEDGFVDQCHLCNTLMSEEALRPVIADALAQLEEELSILQLDVRVLAGDEFSLAEGR